MARQASSARADARSARNLSELEAAEARAAELERQLGVWQAEHEALATDMQQARRTIAGLQQQVGGGARLAEGGQGWGGGWGSRHGGG